MLAHDTRVPLAPERGSTPGRRVISMNERVNIKVISAVSVSEKRLNVPTGTSDRILRTVQHVPHQRSISHLTSWALCRLMPPHTMRLEGGPRLIRAL